MKAQLTFLAEKPEFDALGLVNMIEQPACTYSLDKRSHISQNTAFEILFKGKHPLDVIALFPEEIKEELADYNITEKRSIKNIQIDGKKFSSVQIIPFYRDYLFKFSISKSFSTDYKQIFQIIFDKSPLGLLMVDKNMKFIAANQAICDITGYSLRELKQKTFTDLTHPDDLNLNHPLTRKLYFEETGTCTIQKRYIRKDGKVIWINLFTTLTKDNNGEFLGGMGIVEDITEKRNVEEQRDEFLHSLREKNKEIVDSLVYARNIQNALLPRNIEFKKHFPKHFIYHQPKDIVGGDFYWIRSWGDCVYFAVADCTGHGVPGAFISLIGNYRLNLIFEKYKNSSPALMLEKLNNIIAYSFRNSYFARAHHGMDIAMCCFNLKTGILEFSGANNSMLMIRKGVEKQLSIFLSDEKYYRFSEGDLLEIKADKHPIGSYSGNFRFRSHKIQILEGDRIYLFSDGYADQFGGEKAKKLKMTEFKRILCLGKDTEFSKQKEHIHEARKQWQGDLQQVDDICVLGIEF